MSTLSIPFPGKRTRLSFLATGLGHLLCPSVTIRILEWLFFWQLLSCLALAHIVGLLILWFLLLSYTTEDHAIHVYYHWLQTLVNSQIQRFPHRYHLA